MSPPSSRAQARRQQSLVLSLLVVVVLGLRFPGGHHRRQLAPKLGLDLAGGLSVVYTAGPPGLSRPTWTRRSPS